MQIAFYDPNGNAGRYSDGVRFNPRPTNKPDVHACAAARLTTSTITAQLTQQENLDAGTTRREPEINPTNVTKDYHDTSSIPDAGQSGELDSNYSDDNLRSLFSTLSENGENYLNPAADPNASEHHQADRERLEDHDYLPDTGIEEATSPGPIGELPSAAEDLHKGVNMQDLPGPQRSNSEQGPADDSIASGSFAKGQHRDHTAINNARARSPYPDASDPIFGNSEAIIKDNKSSCGVSCGYHADDQGFVSIADVQSITAVFLTLLAKNSTSNAHSRRSTATTSPSEMISNISDSICRHGRNEIQSPACVSVTGKPLPAVGDEHIDPRLTVNQYPTVEPVAHVPSSDVRKSCLSNAQLDIIEKVDPTMFRYRHGLSGPNMMVADPLPDNIGAPIGSQQSQQDCLIHGRFTSQLLPEGRVYHMTWHSSETTTNQHFQGGSRTTSQGFKEPTKRQTRSKGSKYSPEENEKLIQLRSSGQSWEEIQNSHFSNRTPGALQMHYYHLLTHDKTRKKNSGRKRKQKGGPASVTISQVSSRHKIGPSTSVEVEGLKRRAGDSRYPQRKRHRSERYHPGK
ncbi:hypothetical protein BGW36DRAFT_362833 [Talaromyces proteolyticus]|uniref:Myb-like domain-containing protein n=1 Tax=Talaromyces proteolyticus TaxID=1131652 RepID=A0AAD4PSN8_9EURO|nr:uncharacterized protein BGW36DRAFT_362833 [Talaromyces proteolyticus]KAH8691796.1 hypothetical protein BGW36DRAFT_362833 [Talaromyces proteolyticus]